MSNNVIHMNFRNFLIKFYKLQTEIDMLTSLGALRLA